MENKVRKELIFHGIVQGVGFRYTAAQEARALGLTGFVKNQYDGTVRMEVQGRPGDIADLIRSIGLSLYIEITEVEEKELPLQPKEKHFNIAIGY